MVLITIICQHTNLTIYYSAVQIQPLFKFSQFLTWLVSGAVGEASALAEPPNSQLPTLKMVSEVTFAGNMNKGRDPALLPELVMQ